MNIQVMQYKMQDMTPPPAQVPAVQEIVRRCDAAKLCRICKVHACKSIDIVLYYIMLYYIISYHILLRSCGGATSHGPGGRT